MEDSRQLIELAREHQKIQDFQKEHWEGTFAEYLEIVRRDPKVARNAFQRLYDMIMSYGSREYTQYRDKITHYLFFDDPDHHGDEAVFGLDKPIMELVNAFKSGAMGYGIEKRVLLLHGPVGSSKSTICRLIKRGLERYSRTDAGAMYTFGWIENGDPATYVSDPMHEEPLKLVPHQLRAIFADKLSGPDFRVSITGDLNPFSRKMFADRMRQYGGDWTKVIEDIRVRRLILSEQDRIGIGTFQPKDEKNQDSTELTGDINYRKIAEYGSDSDPRAFNFDGEFNIANRGVVEFIEVLSTLR